MLCLPGYVLAAQPAKTTLFAGGRLALSAEIAEGNFSQSRILNAGRDPQRRLNLGGAINVPTLDHDGYFVNILNVRGGVAVDQDHVG
jgi:hypothetical protein